MLVLRAGDDVAKTPQKAENTEILLTVTVEFITLLRGNFYLRLYFKYCREEADLLCN